MQHLPHARIAVVGLGYVGLPLAIEFAKKFDTTGFDIRSARVHELQRASRVALHDGAGSRFPDMF